MSTLPPLLRTYEEGIAKAAEHLSEMPGMAPFHISHTKLSKKTIPGTDNPIEPEVAAAVEAMPTWRGHEQKTEIVISGLLARHGAPPPPASQRIGQRAFRFLRQLAERFSRAFWTRIAITAASGALVAVLLVPLLAGAFAFSAPLVVVVPSAMADGSPAWFEPGALLALSDPGGAKRPAEQQIPVKTLPGQKVAPCDAELGQVAIHGNCWVALWDVKPPCGRTFRRGDTCYLPVAADPKKPDP